MLSRRWSVLFPCLAVFCLASSLAAQDRAPPERIDILVPPEDYEGPLEDCSDEQEAASISGEIVVCRRRPDSDRYGYDKEGAEKRYAAATMHQGDPQAPDVEGRNAMPMIGVGVSMRGCFIPPCPPPKALIIDIEALPEAPPGSDADRIARGLPPLGRDAASPSDIPQAELGLPPPPESEADAADAAVSPSESASPGAEPSG